MLFPISLPVLPDSLAATFSDSPAHRRHKQHIADSFAVMPAPSPPLTPQPAANSFVGVDRWMAGKSAGSNGNTGSASCAVLCSPRRFVHKTSKENKSGCWQNIETSIKSLPRLCWWGYQAGSLAPANRNHWVHFSPAIKIQHARPDRDSDHPVPLHCHEQATDAN